MGTLSRKYYAEMVKVHRKALQMETSKTTFISKRSEDLAHFRHAF